MGSMSPLVPCLSKIAFLRCFTVTMCQLAMGTEHAAHKHMAIHHTCLCNCNHLQLLYNCLILDTRSSIVFMLHFRTRTSVDSITSCFWSSVSLLRKCTKCQMLYATSSDSLLWLCWPWILEFQFNNIPYSPLLENCFKPEALLHSATSSR